MDKNKLALLCIEGRIKPGGVIALTKGKVYFSYSLTGSYYYLCDDAGYMSIFHKRRFKELEKRVR